MSVITSYRARKQLDVLVDLVLYNYLCLVFNISRTKKRKKNEAAEFKNNLENYSLSSVILP